MAPGHKSNTAVALPTDREILLTRVFNAPRALVFEAWTKPELVSRWWGPGGFTLPVCEIDLRPGGSYRFVMRGPNGREFLIKGVYREVVPPERIVYTDRFDMEGMPSFEGVMTLTFTEGGGKTTLTLRALYDNKDHRDTMLKMQMAEGFGETFDRLDQVLATMETIS